MTDELSGRAAWWQVAAAHGGTVAGLAAGAAERYSDGVAIRHEGVATTFATLADQVSAVARGLVAAGIGPGDRVVIWSANRPDWVVADLAIAMTGAAVVPVYSTSSAEEAVFIAGDTAARVAFCDDPEQAAALQGAELPALERVVAVGPDVGEPAWGGAATPLAAFVEQGGAVADEQVLALAAAVAPGDVYRIIYTSGTTGPPKGCLLTHANLTAAVAMRAAADPVGPLDSFFLFLPLAHAYGLAVQLLALSYGAAAIHASGSMDALLDQLAAERPTHLLAVPRFAEKLHARVTRGHDEIALRAAVEIAESVAATRADGREPLDAIAASHAALDAELFAPARAATGGALRRATIGAAPVGAETLRFFRAAGVLMVQGYGMTETSGFATLSTPDAYRFGAVGRPLPGLDVRIADDGEILLRGPNVFAGYLGGADESSFGATVDGWLHTGDRGRLGRDGLLEVTGRLKNLIVTAGGKNIAPENLERDLVQSPLIDQAVVCGDGRPYPVALIAADPEAAARHPADELRALVQAAVDGVNERYARPERIKAFALLDRPLTVAAGELTASQKVRRAVVLERHSERVDALYPTAAPTN
jgi:long-chain acyl-CoA synthetase